MKKPPCPVCELETQPYQQTKTHFCCVNADCEMQGKAQPDALLRKLAARPKPENEDSRVVREECQGTPETLRDVGLPRVLTDEDG